MKRTLGHALLYSAILASALSFAMPAAKISALPVIPYFAAAGGGCPLPDGRSGTLQGDGKTCCPGSNANADATQCIVAKYISPTIALLSAAVGVLVVISIMYGGFETITAGPDVSKAAAGRKRIVQALVGLFAYLVLFALLQFLIPGGVV